MGFIDSGNPMACNNQSKSQPSSLSIDDNLVFFRLTCILVGLGTLSHQMSNSSIEDLDLCDSFFDFGADDRRDPRNYFDF